MVDMAEVQVPDIESQEWIDSLRSVVQDEGRARARTLLGQLIDWGKRNDVVAPFTANTPYINTIPVERQTPFPGGNGSPSRAGS